MSDISLDVFIRQFFKDVLPALGVDFHVAAHRHGPVALDKVKVKVVFVTAFFSRFCKSCERTQVLYPPSKV